MIAPVRVARNVAEKQRRDKLNAFIADLANSVPLVASATKRLDKTSILRLAAAFLRLHDSPLNTIGYNMASSDILEGPSKSFLPEKIMALMEGLEGFVIVINSDLKLIYVSQSCEKFLGHQNIDMMGFPLTAFIHPGDMEAVRHVMEETRRELIRSGKKESDRIQFRCRMKERSQPRTEVVTYQMVQIVGSFQFPKETPATYTTNPTSGHPRTDQMDTDIESIEGASCSSSFNPLSPGSIHGTDSNTSGCSSFISTSTCSHPSTSAVFKKRKLEDASPCSPSSEASSGVIMSSKRMAMLSCPPFDSDGRPQQQVVSPNYIAKNLLFKGFVQIIPSSPMAELSLIDANQEEYVTRLSLDGVLLYADHR